jgi:hypothetical protein
MLILCDENAASRIALEHRDLSIAAGNLEVERAVPEQMPDWRQEDGSVLAMQS